MSDFFDGTQIGSPWKLAAVLLLVGMIAGALLCRWWFG
jgi:F0F1-type ATP synthase assembly protein I